MKEGMKFLGVLFVVIGIVSCTYDKKEKAPEATPPPAAEKQMEAPAASEEPAGEAAETEATEESAEAPAAEGAGAEAH